MEPGFYRGDILGLTLFHEVPFTNADVVVFQIEGRDVPIVHRALNVHESNDGKIAMLTKGDNNQVDDRGLYALKQLFIGRKEVMGRARAFMPLVGMVRGNLFLFFKTYLRPFCNFRKQIDTQNFKQKIILYLFAFVR